MILAIVVSAIGATAGFFLGLVAWLRDRTRSWQTLYLSLMAAAVGGTMLEDALVLSRAYDGMPDLFGWSYPAFVSIGPLLSLYVARMADPVDRSLKNQTPVLVCAALILALLTPWYWSGGRVRWAIELGLPAGRDALWAVWSMVLFMLASAGLQLFCFVRSHRRALTIADPNRRLWTTRLTQFAIVGCGAYGICLGLDLLGWSNDLVLTLLNLLLAVSLYSLTALAIVEPPDPQTQPAQASIAAARYARSALTPQDMDRIMARVGDLAARQHIHRDSGLTLQKLAQAARVSPNDLSQTLNTRADGFYAWLARTRIDDVKSQLLGGEDITGLMDAAFLAGFNSKSTFYEAFRRETGATPAAWLKGARQSGAGSGL